MFLNNNSYVAIEKSDVLLYYIIMNIYFDNAATTKVCEEAAEAVNRVMCDVYGNPSSPHHMGRAAAKELSDARASVAEAIGAQQNEIYFTSGGTESVNWAVLGSIPAHFNVGKHILTSATEHSAVLESVKKREQIGWEVTYLKPGKDGYINTDDFSSALRDDTAFVSIMLVNNETGAINPISDFAKIIKARGLNTIFHSDAVQGLGKIPIDVKSLGVDLLSVSSHKLHGPMGAGALFTGSGIVPESLLFGGVQEEKKRPGTEALPAIAGFGTAVKIAVDRLNESFEYVKGIREYLVKELKSRLHDIEIIGSGGSPYILNLSLPGYKSEVIMNYLDTNGICVTKGSACRKGLRSRVLVAMDLKNEIIDGAIRVSFSRYSTIEEADVFVKTLEKASQTLLKH